MHRSIKVRALPTLAFGAALTAVCAGLTACGTAEPVAYSAIASSAQLAPNTQGDAARIPFRYSAASDLRSYNRAIIEPVAIYRGPDHQFGDLSESDKAALAAYMQAQFAERLRTRFAIASDPAPNTLRVRLTLTGAATSTPVLAPLSRVDLAGGIYNGVQSLRGGEGTLTGAVIYAVEIYDAPSNRLLRAFVSKQYPNALNIMASMGSLAAARAGIEKGADALIAQLR
ncbi:DUF3313 domain-containing protein [Roseococcus sp.]|uniref:DUF3313 domain-containing protein n=1 Tax=Roseococcus sp. TaxID=2109646 RepID=UPI003BABD68A